MSSGQAAVALAAHTDDVEVDRPQRGVHHRARGNGQGNELDGGYGGAVTGAHAVLVGVGSVYVTTGSVLVTLIASVSALLVSALIITCPRRSARR